MSDWPAPVRFALDASTKPVQFFFRDDDAGWEHEALSQLVDRCQVSATRGHRSRPRHGRRTATPVRRSDFTPPWNRCTDQTAAALANLGFQVLSRDHTAIPVGLDELTEIPVTVDWFAKTKDEPWTPEHVATQIANRVVEGTQPVGIMLHHAITNVDHLALIDQLLALIASHPSATSTSIYNAPL